MKCLTISLTISITLIIASASFPQISSEEYDHVVDFCISKLSASIEEISKGSGYPIRTEGIGKWELTSDNPFNWDASTSWGDYYFLESLYRYKRSFMK